MGRIFDTLSLKRGPKVALRLLLIKSDQERICSWCASTSMVGKYRIKKVLTSSRGRYKKNQWLEAYIRAIQIQYFFFPPTSMGN